MRTPFSRFLDSVPSVFQKKMELRVWREEGRGGERESRVVKEKVVCFCFCFLFFFFV